MQSPGASAAPMPASASDLPFVSIVIPTFGRRARILKLLWALGQQTYPADRFEVVVVDDGSPDGTPAAVRHLTTPYALRVIERNHAGPAAARNAGVEQARGPLIQFLDDDVLPHPELLAEHLAVHRSAPGSVVVGPMLPPPSTWTRPPWIRWEEARLQEIYRDMTTGKYACTARQFFTANASLLREQFLSAGGFDRALLRAEDVELGFRLRDRGANFTFLPSAVVWHYPERSFADWCRTPGRYGRADVVMTRDKGHEAFVYATRELKLRHPLTRLLVWSCAGRPVFARGATQVLGGLARGADRLHGGRVALIALSAIFNLLYWQGVTEELGGRAQVRQALAEGGLLRVAADQGASVATPAGPG
jgi:GT2 family glycosyltransferase